VTLDPPAALSQRVLNALKADPRTVDLRALAPHFYNLGARILELFDEEEMIEVLSEVRPLVPDLPNLQEADCRRHTSPAPL
jgi:hypothetical protein